MASADDIISSLSQEGAKVQSTASPMRLMGVWIAFLYLYVFAIFTSHIFHLRPDILSMLVQPLFTAELVALSLLIMSSIAALVLFSFPDQYQKPHIIYVPLAGFISFVAVLAAEWAVSPVPDAFSFQGFECLSCIVGLLVIPAAFMIYKVRRMATTCPNRAGLTAALCAFAIGAFILRLVEATNSIQHLVMWHYAPMMIFALLGLWLGPKLLKW